ncbi:hypothetical protein EMIHUDRAFT_453616 [Emiliania huxleyi CCMP1516]|uniref:Fibronectin type-III domain-containing protein n=2 Tax=Emiliania huxleyi TaxID=2903 RepID=A0A0D3I3F5_EMIH1|nr:hypothetical protein EMIHUDRAFT_453616 [Emiliania huxleyi CCMP1516]EOD05790.1 hypothetical protein EMIHUDRAFT_453616 [Emiliania huxleyi CCMP1516]|eukprot:XP_005758219.1 hypothetical protein EMIHUDRAFT_453616 [Emiliania huxleyi CCMP1516]
MAAMAATTELSRHATFTSKGAPDYLAYVNGAWTRDASQPYRNGKPIYFRRPSAGDTLWPAGIAALTLHAAEDGESWCIADSAGSTLAVARSDAGHPNTVDPAEWRLRGGGLDAEYLRHEAFSLQTEGPNTEAEPFLLEELGRDYFVRVQLKSRRILWFVDPGTGGVCHTAANKCISANNFQSQHILQVHRPGRTTGLTILAGPGGSDASLSWEPPSSDGGFKIVAYRVAVSADGGASWATLRDVPTHELSPSTLLPGQLCATVSLEQQHLPCASALGLGPSAPLLSALAKMTRSLSIELSAMVDSAEGGGEPSLSPSDLSAARSDLSPLSATRTDLAFSDSDEAESGRLPADDEMPPAFCLADLCNPPLAASPRPSY